MRMLVLTICAGLAATSAAAQRRPVYVQPEIRPQLPVQNQFGVPATNPVADVTARVDALEGQIARLTGQIEEDGNRIRQLEAALARAESIYNERLDALERRPAPVPAPSDEGEAQAIVGAPGTETSEAPGRAPTVEGETASDAGEEAYTAGYRLWQSGEHAAAARALQAMAKSYPRHRRASYARNLAGRALLDAGNAEAAAPILLGNYESDPKGERAADSLVFLGEALIKLDRADEACRALDELQQVYGETMRDFVRERLTAARATAGCS